MDGYTILAGGLIFFGLFIYLTWFGTSIKMESQKKQERYFLGDPKFK